MKQLICVIWAIMLALSLCACTGSTNDPTTTPTEGQVQVTESTPGQIQPTEDPRYTEVERDENGNIIRTLEGERGVDCIECFYDASGILLQEIIDTPDGQHEDRAFYADGTIARELISMPDGTVVETEFRENGIPLRETVTQATGFMQIREFYDDGTCSFEQQQNPDGSFSEREFDQAGQLVRDISIDPNGVVQDNLAATEPSVPDDSGDNSGSPDHSDATTGTLVGSVTQDGDYTVVVLGQDNCSDYLEEYMDVLFLPNEDRVIIRKYFLVKDGVGEVDADRSHVELQYIFEHRDVSCTVDMANKVFTPGSILSVGGQELSYAESDQFRVLGWQYVDGELIGYGLSCSACELSGASVSFPNPTIVGLAWVTGTLYLK